MHLYGIGKGVTGALFFAGFFRFEYFLLELPWGYLCVKGLVKRISSGGEITYFICEC